MFAPPEVKPYALDRASFDGTTPPRVTDAITENRITVVDNFAKFLLANDLCNCIQTLLFSSSLDWLYFYSN